MPEHIAVVGAGQAGAALALRLRSIGYEGRLTIYGAEPHPPYQRPPLSKKYLGGEWQVDRLYLRPASLWAQLGVDIRLGAVVTSIDAARKTLCVGNEEVAWDRLVLTTGASPRAVPPNFAAKDGVYDLRSLADVDRLRDVFDAGRDMVVIGGGFIGLETAAVAAQRGLRVSVIEQADRILERAVGARTSAFFRTLHERNGVRIVEGSSVAHVAGGDRVRTVALQSGELLNADLVLIGIGVLPNISLAASAGLRIDNGILVDERGRTSAPDVWAAGDCAAFPLDGEIVRLESVQNAIDQAEAAADDMLGKGEPYRPVPWFWSDQYDVKLQIAGLSRGHTRVVTRRSATGEAHWYFKGERLMAVDAINDARSFMTARKLLSANTPVDAHALADGDLDLRTLLA